MKKLILILSLISIEAFGIGYQTSYSSEVKIKNGTQEGVLKVNLPRVIMSRSEKKISSSHSFLNTRGLSSNYVQILDYICMNGKVVLFKEHSQSIYESKMSFSNTFASGTIIDSLFKNSFQFLADNLRISNSNASYVACSENFLKSARPYDIKLMKNRKIENFSLTKEGSKRKPILKITWE